MVELESDKNTEIIPSSTETYIAVSKSVKLQSRRPVRLQSRGKKTEKHKEVYLKIIFKDSYRFISASIDSLAKSLDPNHDFKNLEKHFPVHSEMLKRKGVFPYELVQSDEVYEMVEFPPPDAFKTCLNDYEPISDEDYNFAKTVYHTFGCNNIGDYSDIYLKTDVCILADIYEKFREECLDVKLYGLDPVHFYTSPGLAWNAMLKITGVEIELLSDIEKFHFFRDGIRGGLSQCSLRKAEAKNKFTNPDENIPDPSYLLYLDVNNLYGWAMCEKLPISNFEWLTEDQLDYFNINEVNPLEDDYGYVLEVDVEYPQELDLHESHNDLPFMPERMKVSKGGVSKLITSLKNKEKYIIHCANLKQALKHNLKLKKIHRILSFKQSAWMKPYIELNNKVRTNAIAKTTKDLCKLMNNSVFGRTLENVLCRRLIRIFDVWYNQLTGKRGAQSFMSSGYLKKSTIFGPHCIAVELNQKHAKLNKPIQIGFTILELAKMKIYEFHYDFMKKLYPDPEKLKLAYTDTDSFIYQIFTENVYEDLKPFIHKENPSPVELFDTSDYPEPNQFGIKRVNKKVLGAMKDECSGKIMSSFIGLRAKCYSYKMLNDVKEVNKNKGVKSHAMKNLLIEDYGSCLLDREKVINKKQYVFRSRMHDIYTEEVNKVALNGKDDKRFIRGDGIHTYAWGHMKINEEEAARLIEGDIEILENEFLEMEQEEAVEDEFLALGFELDE